MFTLVGTVEAFQEVHIVVPLAAGISLPNTALPANFKDFKIMATAQAGNVLPTQIGSSPSIGFLDSEISYADVHHDDQRFLQLQFDMSLAGHARKKNDTIVFSFILDNNFTSGDWMPVDIAGRHCCTQLTRHTPATHVRKPVRGDAGEGV